MRTPQFAVCQMVRPALGPHGSPSDAKHRPETAQERVGLTDADFDRAQSARFGFRLFGSDPAGRRPLRTGYEMKPDLAAYYGEARLPRYTSYPTAPHFSSAIGPAS